LVVSDISRRTSMASSVVVLDMLSVPLDGLGNGRCPSGTG
jgi:hypothetical protein